MSWPVNKSVDWRVSPIEAVEEDEFVRIMIKSHHRRPLNVFIQRKKMCVSLKRCCQGGNGKMFVELLFGKRWRKYSPTEPGKASEKVTLSGSFPIWMAMQWERKMQRSCCIPASASVSSQMPRERDSLNQLPIQKEGKISPNMWFEAKRPPIQIIKVHPSKGRMSEFAELPRVELRKGNFYSFIENWTWWSSSNVITCIMRVGINR